MPPLQSTHIPWHLNGICSSLFHEHGVSFCSRTCMGMSVLKREAAVLLGKQQAGFLGLSSSNRGWKQPLNGSLRQPSKPFQLHLHLCIIRTTEAAAVTQWLFVNNSLTILLPEKENFSFSSLHRLPGVWGAMVMRSLYKHCTLWLLWLCSQSLSGNKPIFMF